MKVGPMLLHERIDHLAASWLGPMFLGERLASRVRRFDRSSQTLLERLFAECFLEFVDPVRMFWVLGITELLRELAQGLGFGGLRLQLRISVTNEDWLARREQMFDAGKRLWGHSRLMQMLPGVGRGRRGGIAIAMLLSPVWDRERLGRRTFPAGTNAPINRGRAHIPLAHIELIVAFRRGGGTGTSRRGASLCRAADMLLMMRVRHRL